MRKARYRIEEITREHILIRDLGPWNQFPTITNAAEEVVEELVAWGRLSEGQRLFYIDSEGTEDEIIVKGLRFAGFRPGRKNGRAK